MWGDPGQNGNGQSYCGSNPVNLVDPLGLNSVRTDIWDGLNKAADKLGNGDLLGAAGTAWWTGVKAAADATPDGVPNPIAGAIKGYESGKAALEALEALADGTLAVGDTFWNMLEEMIGKADLEKAKARWAAGDEVGAMLEAIDAVEKALETVGMICVAGELLAKLRLKIRARRGGGTQTRPPKNPSDGASQPNPGGCFFAGTIVLTPTGGVPIEQLKSGDLVLSRDERSGALAYKRVIRVHRGHGARVCRLTIVHPRARSPRAQVGQGPKCDESGEEGSEPPPTEQQIESTPGHDYYRVDDGDWVDAEKLRPNDHVLDSSGAKCRVVRVEVWAEKRPTWNMEVEDFHTYFVAERRNVAGVLVHNGSPDIPVVHGASQAPETGPPNSMYEQLGPNGELKSRSWYDQNGNRFLRQDFDASGHKHPVGRPATPEGNHEHKFKFFQKKDGKWVMAGEEVAKMDPRGYSDPTPPSSQQPPPTCP